MARTQQQAPEVPPLTGVDPATRAGRLRAPQALRAWLLLTPVVVYLGTVFVWPVLTMLVRSVWEGGPTWSSYLTLTRESVYAKALLNTFQISLLVTAICLVLGYAMAYLMAISSGPRLGRILAITVLLSFWTSSLVRTFSWLIILGRHGLVAGALQWMGMVEPPQMLYNTIGALVGIVNIMLPYMVLTLYAVMRQVDPSLRRAAASLGATPFRSFWTVFVPATMPGIAAGSVLVFMITVGFYVTPALLGGPDSIMISQLIADQVQRLLNWPLAGALSTVLILICVPLALLYNRILGVGRLQQGVG